MGIRKELARDLKKPTEAAVKKLVDGFKVDEKSIKEALSNALKDVSKALATGSTVAEAIADLDTVATFELAGAYADMGRHQAKMLKAAQGILKQAMKLAMKQIAVALL